MSDIRDNEPILILGAGPAGIGAGLALGDRARVVEGQTSLGGLCRTITFEGAVFDLGGHSFHTPHRAIRDLVFGALEMVEQTRDARCFFDGEMIPFPFQKNFLALADAATREECAAGLRQADDGQRARNFEDYLIQRFGPGIARHFLLPYNEKLWGADLSRLDVDWVSQRVTPPSDGRPDKIRARGEREPLQGDSRVAYPARGGFGEIFQALARRLRRVSLGQRVARIDPRRREVWTADGDRLLWEQIVSTLPLPSLLALVDDVPAEIWQDVKQLRALALDIVLVVVGHPIDTPVQRVYCSDPRIPGHKIALNHNSSPSLRSLPRHGIAVEVSRTLAYESATADLLTAEVVAGLVEMGLVRSAREIVATRVLSVPAAYPIPSMGRKRAVDRILAWLADREIHSVGRFGEWAYINCDEALYRGIRLGELLSLGHDPAPLAVEEPAITAAGTIACVRT